MQVMMMQVMLMLSILLLYHQHLAPLCSHIACLPSSSCRAICHEGKGRRYVEWEKRKKVRRVGDPMSGGVSGIRVRSLLGSDPPTTLTRVCMYTRVRSVLSVGRCAQRTRTAAKTRPRHSHAQGCQRQRAARQARRGRASAAAPPPCCATAPST